MREEISSAYKTAVCDTVIIEKSPSKEVEYLKHLDYVMRALRASSRRFTGDSNNASLPGAAFLAQALHELEDARSLLDAGDTNLSRLLRLSASQNLESALEGNAPSPVEPYDGSWLVAYSSFQESVALCQKVIESLQLMNARVVDTLAEAAAKAQKTCHTLGLYS